MREKQLYPVKFFIKQITYFVLFLFTRYYGIKKSMPDNVKNLKPPYLVLSNHVGYWDPFVIGYLMPDFVQYVSSDAAFRNPLVRFFLKGLGTIPKKKNIRDSKVIRDITAVIRQGRSVGIFPEGVRNWSGKTQSIDLSIAKLIIMLKVPVVVPVMKGMSLLNPRWSPKLRKTKVVIEYRLLLTANDIESKTVGEIYRLLTDALQYDDVEHQKKEMNVIKSKFKAEFINHTLYLCPECTAIDSFIAKNNNFFCKYCNYDIHINSYGFFKRITEGMLYYDNIKDWFFWQEEKFQRMIAEKFDSQFQGFVFEDKASKVYKSNRFLDMELIDQADIRFFIDKIVVVFKNIESFVINFNDLQTINSQVNERLEIYYKGEAYRIIGGRPGVSALKWELAVNVIWKKLGQHHKRSPYINHIN